LLVFAFLRWSFRFLSDFSDAVTSFANRNPLSSRDDEEVGCTDDSKGQSSSGSVVRRVAVIGRHHMCILKSKKTCDWGRVKCHKFSIRAAEAVSPTAAPLSQVVVSLSPYLCPLDVHSNLPVSPVNFACAQPGISLGDALAP
jgi:hypothetical protein